MTVAEAGLPEDTQRGWRRALFHALSDGEKPPHSRKRRRPIEPDLFNLPLFEAIGMSHTVTPFSLKDAPCAHRTVAARPEAFRRGLQGANGRCGKTLTALGSYWKGRKPLILNKACILGCLLPATDNPKRDLEIFEKLMAMDDESFVARWPRRPSPKEILATLSIACVADYFIADPTRRAANLRTDGLVEARVRKVKVTWRDDISASCNAAGLKCKCLPRVPYRNALTRPGGPRRLWTRSTITSGKRSTNISVQAPARSPS